MTNETELMNCPFCKGEAFLAHDYFTAQYTPDDPYVECRKCHVRALNVESWNTRAVPEGHALVPLEPTEEMLIAMEDGGAHYEHGPWNFLSRAAYKAMIAAAQKVGSDEKPNTSHNR